jgi:hypothetical protein
MNISPKWNQVPRLAFTMLCVAMVGVTLAPTAAADESDKKTIVTFSAPVEIPGKALPAGTDVFKVLDTSASPNIFQVFDKDEKQVHVTLMAEKANSPSSPPSAVWGMLIQIEATCTIELGC